MEIKANCIALSDLKQQLSIKDDYVIIDVRSEYEYNELHIPLAINIPIELLEDGAKKLTKDKKYVTVCGKGGGRSADGANKLKELGLDAIYLCGGTFGWFENK